MAPQPIRESSLLTGPLESTNRPYALAKIAGIEMCWAYNRQYGTRYLAAMPTNLYGPGDNYDLETSHVIPALLRKIVQAKETKASSVSIWGTGTAKREFLHSDDLADGLLFLMNLSQADFARLANSDVDPPIVNVGFGKDLSIRELAEIIAEVVGFHGTFVFDSNKPDGTPKKQLDISKLGALGWFPKIELRAGLARTYREYLETNM